MQPKQSSHLAVGSGFGRGSCLCRGLAWLSQFASPISLGWLALVSATWVQQNIWYNTLQAKFNRDRPALGCCAAEPGALFLILLYPHPCPCAWHCSAAGVLGVEWLGNWPLHCHTPCIGQSVLHRTPQFSYN